MPRRPTAAKHVCHIGVRARGYAYLRARRGGPRTSTSASSSPAPSGELWTWGPEDAAERVTGCGWDFALLATRRRHRDDVDVHGRGRATPTTGSTIVQAFAGMPGNDPDATGGEADAS